MASIERHADSVSSKILPHFKSSNCFETVSNKRATKIKRDLSSVSNYYLPTERKNSDLLTAGQESKSLIDTLPDINTKRQAKKRSGFLEMWLEEALDPQGEKGESSSHVEVEKTGPLRTVQKFQIDKKYLKSQNISGQVVDKLYNSLYVYTHGINHTFNELLSLTKTSEHAERRIVNSFWRAFVKLLEGCTSYRTTFQVIEENYRKQADEIKANFAVREAEFQEEKEKLQAEVTRLARRLSEESNSLAKLNNDYNIALSSLHLTDQAFNDEVALRLKFQEKVNSVFTSYDEIRHKYEKLLADLHAKNQDQVSWKHTERVLRAQLEQSEIRGVELQRQLARADEQLAERDKEIELKRQEIYDLNGKVADLTERRDENQEQARRIVIKLDHYRHQNQSLLNEITIKDQQLAELSRRTQDQQAIISAVRQANERVFEQCEATGKQLGSFNAERLQLEAIARQARDAQREAETAKTLAKARCSQLQAQVGDLEYKVRILQQEVALKNDFLTKNAELIRSLQAVKDKFERLYTLTSAEKARMEAEMNQAVRLKELFEEEMAGMRMLLESRMVELEEANSKLQNERQVFRSKITSLKDEIAAKEEQILDFHNRQLEDRQIVTKATETIKTSQSQVATLTEEKLKLQGDLLYKDKLLDESILERHKNTELLRELNTRLEEVSLQQQSCRQDLTTKTSVLEQMRGRADREKDLLRRMLDSYREDREKKSCYVHPMIYQDCRMQIDRSTQTIADKQAEIKYLQRQIEELRQNIQQLEDNISMLRGGLLKGEAQNDTKREIISSLQLKRSELETLVKQLRRQIAESATRQQTCNKKIQEQRLDLIRANEELEHRRLAIKAQTEAIDRLEDQKKIQNIHYQAQEEEVNALKAEIGRLKDELVSFRRIDSKNSSRPQMPKRKSTAQEREGSSKGQERQLSKVQERQNLQTPRESNLDTFLSEDFPLKPIQEERKKEEGPRPSTVDREAQTEREKEKQKEKPKFSHNFKFQQVHPANESYGCQVDLPAIQNTHVPPSHSQPKRMEGEQIRRVLKLTYMRR